MGVPFWLKSDDALRQLVEQVAKAHVRVRARVCVCAGFCVSSFMTLCVCAWLACLSSPCHLQYAVDRDPFACILFYAMLGVSKLPVLAQLFRLSSQPKVFEFLSKDNKQEQCVLLCVCARLCACVRV